MTTTESSKLTRIALNIEVVEAVVVLEGEGGVDTEGEEQTHGEDELLERF